MKIIYCNFAKSERVTKYYYYLRQDMIKDESSQRDKCQKRD